MYNGIVNVYKEPGFTSHDVVAKLRGIYGQKKVGHTGTLDPMAEGVLIVVLGQATKLSDLILTSRKQYIATMKLGVITETDDTTGEKQKLCDGDKLRALVSDEKELRNKLESLFKEFLGKSMQVPPLYSAIKINGKKLYEYAREGIEIKPDARPVEIYSLELMDVEISMADSTSADNLNSDNVSAMDCYVRFKVDCSKGTYIRALIRDMGEKLGVGAAMSALVRDEINGIYAKDGLRIEELQKLKEEGRLGETVLPIDKLLSDYPSVRVKKSGEKLLANGNRLRREDIEVLRGNEISGDNEMSSDIEMSDNAMISVETDTQALDKVDFFRVYLGDELKALYTYDKQKRDYKVFKML